MADFIEKEIDKIGEMLLGLMERLGVVGQKGGQKIDHSKINAEMQHLRLNLDVEKLLDQPMAVTYLVEEIGLSDMALESFANLMYHSDCDEQKVQKFIRDVIAFLESHGYYSFLLRSIPLK